MTGVGLRGRDADLAIDMGTVEQRINAAAGTICMVDLGSINLMQHQNTWRRVNVRHQNFTKKLLFFHLRLDEQLDQGSSPVGTRYPQKHVIYVVLHGANGTNGFLPSSAGGIGYYKAISKFSNTLQIRQWYGASNISHFTGIAEDDDWAVGSIQHWNSEYSAISLPNTKDFNQIYTRNSSLIAQLTSNQASPFFSMNHQTLRIAKSCHLFWSRNNVCTFRIELDLRDRDMRFISIKKFTGSSDYS